MQDSNAAAALACCLPASQPASHCTNPRPGQASPSASHLYPYPIYHHMYVCNYIEKIECLHFFLQFFSLTSSQFIFLPLLCKSYTQPFWGRDDLSPLSHCFIPSSSVCAACLSAVQQPHHHQQQQQHQHESTARPVFAISSHPAPSSPGPFLYW